MRKTQEIFIGFHAGRIVQYLAATYGRLEQVIGELVQNIIDARATEATVYLDLKKRELRAWDNGDGATLPEMQKRIEHIGAPLKEKLAKKKGPMIGRRGIGNLAVIALKGEKSVWNFFSHKPLSRTDQRWFSLSLNMHDLDNKTQVSFVPLHHEPGFKPIDSKDRVLLGCTTLVTMTDIEPNTLVELLRTADNPAVVIAHSISETFSAALLRHKVKINISVIDAAGALRTDTVRPQSYPGEKRDVTIDGVTFEIYVTRTNQKKARLFVEHEGLVSFPLSGQKDLWELVNPILGSGFFQGVIRTGLGELTPNRTRFQYNKDYNKFAEAVIDFTTRYAEPWLNHIRETSRDDKVAQVLENVLDRVAPFLDDYPDLLGEMFKAAKNLPGHASEEGSPDSIFHTRVKGGSSGRHSTGEKKPTPTGTVPSKPDGHGIVRGGRVLRHTCGLSVKTIDADPAHPYGMRWRIRLGDTGLDKGLILFNRSHPDWAAAEEKGGSSLDTYVILLLLMLLSLPLVGNDSRAQIFREEFEESFMRFKGPLVPRIPAYGAKSPRHTKKFAATTSDEQDTVQK